MLENHSAQLLDDINHHGILLCNEGGDLPSLCGLGYGMGDIVPLIEQKKVFYCKAYQKRSTYLSVEVVHLLSLCRYRRPLDLKASVILKALQGTPNINKDDLRTEVEMEKKVFDHTFDFLLENMLITASGGNKLNPNWYSYLYCTAENWEKNDGWIATPYNPKESKEALWKIVGGSMSEASFDSFTK